MDVEIVLTLSDDFNNEPVFLKFDIKCSRKCTDLSTSTIDRCTSFLMYIIFSFSFLSFPLSYDLCHQNQINHFRQAKCC